MFGITRMKDGCRQRNGVVDDAGKRLGDPWSKLALVVCPLDSRFSGCAAMPRAVKRKMQPLPKLTGFNCQRALQLWK
jgi:hypothetical protein